METPTKRISFDVPEEIHTFLKVECAKAHIALRDLMKEITLRTVEELKKKKLHEILLKGFQESYEGKGREITDADFDRWEKMIDES